MIDEFRRILVSHVPTSEKVVTCDASDRVHEVLKKMQDKRIGSIIIVEEEHVIGIFTERDYFFKIAGKESAYLQSPISDFMTPNPKCVRSTDMLFKVLLLMRMGRFRHIVVSDEGGRLDSVVSIKDILDVLIDEQ